MADKSKKRKKGSITEESISTLLLRYSVNTLLKLLQEVAISGGQKIDWNAIVKNTTTGIPNAREYQMLWRHLAYGQALTDQHDNPANPLDDDSDIEDEVEAFPVVSRESTAEAAACVKVLVASDYPIDSHVPNNLSIEAPLIINIPMVKVPSDSSLPANAMLRTNISIPVSVQKELPSFGTSGEKRPKDGKSGADVPPRRKRKVWSTEDDLKLTAAVQKHGEQNWANIAVGDFKNDRTPEELSLRWASIRKKKSNLNAGTSAELSEARKAATRAIFLALEPKGHNFNAARQMSNVRTKTTQHESHIASAPPSNPQLGMAGPPKSQVLTERPPLHCTTSPTSMIKVAAVAAGARIATPADASSVIEAAPRSQNVVHIRTGASSLARSSTTSVSNQLYSNSYRNGPTKAPVSAHSSTVPNLQLGVAKEAQGNSIKPKEKAVQPNPVGTAVILDVSPGKEYATSSIPNQALKTAEVAAGVSTSLSEMKELVPSDQVAGLDNIYPKAVVELISEDLSASIGNPSKPEIDERTSTPGSTQGGNTQGDQTSISSSRPVNQTQGLQVVLPGSEVEDNGKEIHDNTSFNGKHGNLSCKSLNGRGEASIVKATARTKDDTND
ncbi:hypothetical protein C2S51_009149 [Perilla frutescens var. frutescens]|nr:hypothetical protein C2S51_009149 [Perilla frutescens var. frutescens]